MTNLHEGSELDEASAQTLAFVAADCPESVGLVFAARSGDEGQQWSGLPELVVDGWATRMHGPCFSP